MPIDDPSLYAKVEWTPNAAGVCPVEARGKRVLVELHDGTFSGMVPASDVSPRGWAADGKQGCSWHVHSPPRPHNIRRYSVI